MVVLYDHALARARRWRGVSSVCFLGILLVSRGPPPGPSRTPAWGVIRQIPARVSLGLETRIAGIFDVCYYHL
jgi:hypothetical protein